MEFCYIISIKSLLTPNQHTISKTWAYSRYGGCVYVSLHSSGEASTRLWSISVAIGAQSFKRAFFLLSTHTNDKSCVSLGTSIHSKGLWVQDIQVPPHYPHQIMPLWTWLGVPKLNNFVGGHTFSSYNASLLYSTPPTHRVLQTLFLSRVFQVE